MLFQFGILDVYKRQYLTKPFSLEELSARIRVLIRRSGVERVDNTIKVGPLTLDTDKKTAVRDGKEISLTAKAVSYTHLDVYKRQSPCSTAS